jgi:hypothetical protein
MNPRSTVYLLCAALAASVSLAAIAWLQKPAPAGRMRWDARRSLGAPKTYRNLTLIPVYDSAARAADTYLTLDEGLKAKVVRVKESRGGGEVNTLYITNTGRKPVYVMAGEVVLGGQQDRCLGRDTIVPPGKRNLPITVFCVEHGRWTGRSEFDRTTLAAAAPDIRAEAQEAAFMASRPAAMPPPGANMMSGGQPVQRAQSADTGEAQAKVWQKVAEKNRRFKTENETGTYRQVLDMAGGDARTDITPYMKALSGSLGSDPHLVGVVAAINGKVTAADIFGDPSLFRRLWPKLLRSYAADAAERATASKRSRPAVTPAQAKAFLAAATDAKSRTENRSDVSATLRLESKDARAYLLVPRARAQAGGGFGGAVHGSFVGK